jgi:hypothetical protein
MLTLAICQRFFPSSHAKHSANAVLHAGSSSSAIQMYRFMLGIAGEEVREMRAAASHKLGSFVAAFD